MVSVTVSRVLCSVAVLAMAVVLSALASLPVSARVVITEIMYDPMPKEDQAADAGYEWLEVMNDGTQAVDMTAFHLMEGNTRHHIRESDDGRELRAGGIGIIAQDAAVFSGEYPEYTGPVFVSIFSFRQQGGIGEKIGIYSIDDRVVMSSFTYVPDPRASGTGASLHIINNKQIAAPATPGSAAVNPITVVNDDAPEADSEQQEEEEDEEEETHDEEREQDEADEGVADTSDEITELERKVRAVITNISTADGVREPVPDSAAGITGITVAPAQKGGISPATTPADAPSASVPSYTATGSYDYSGLLIWILVLLIIIVVELYIIIIILYRRTGKTGE